VPSYRPSTPLGEITPHTLPLSLNPDPPREFVPREPELSKLLEWIRTSAEQPQPICILSGAPGMGKSVLARQFAEHEDVLHLFGHLIFFVQAGINPTDLPDQINEIGFDCSESWVYEIDQQRAIQRLYQHFNKSNILIIVDDVRTVEQALQFSSDSDRIKVLVISRNRRISRALDAPEVVVEELTEEQAEQACQYYDTSLPSLLCKQRVTRIPLILHLANLCLARGLRIPKPDEELTFDEMLYELWSLLLNYYSVPYQALIHLLGIFPALTPLSYPVISKLWSQAHTELNESGIDGLLDELKLLRILSHRTHSNTASLSDLFQQFVDRGLDLDLAALHKTLLELYPPEAIFTEDTNYDEYIYRFLPFHLLGANHSDTLFKILLSVQWISTKIQKTDVNALQLDYLYGRSDITIRLVDEAIRLAASILETDTSQIISQLIGRLQNIDIHAVSDLVDALRTYRSSESIWLDPWHVDLKAPSSTLMLTLEGHLAEVLGVDVDTKKQRAISVSRDHSVFVWDLESKEIIHKLTSYPEAAEKVILFSRGKQAITVAGNTITHWDIHKGKQLRQHSFHRTPVISIYLFPNESNVMSADEAGNIFFWNLNTGEVQGNLKPDQEAPWAIASMNREPIAFTAGNDETIQAWDLNTGKLRYSLTGHEDWVWALCVTKDDKYLLSASEDHTIIVWDLEAAKVVRVLKGHKAGVRFLSLTEDDNLVLSADAEQSIILWDLRSGKILRSFSGLTNWIHDFEAMPSGEAAFLATDEPEIKLWSMREGMLHDQNAQSHDKGIRALRLAPGDIQLISASDDATIRKWHSNTAKLIDSYTGHTDWISSICLSRGGSKLISASFDRTLRVWDLETGDCTRILEGHMDWVWCAAVSDNNRFIASGSEDRTVITWDLQNGAINHVFTAHDDAVTTVLISADSRHIISSSLDQTLCVWDEQSGSLKHVLEGHTDTIRSVALSLMGDRLVSGSDDATIRIWNFVLGMEDECFTNPGGSVQKVYFLPNGYHLLSISEDHVLRVWDLVLSKPVFTLEAHSDEISHLAVSKSGRWAATTGSDRKLCLWDLENGHLIDSYYADVPMTYCIFSTDGRQLIGADAGGGLHFLHVRGNWY